MLDQFLDRMLDRIFTAVVDKLTYIGLVIIGLFDRAGSGLRGLKQQFENPRDRKALKGYAKNLVICAASVSILILLLVVRLSMIEMKSTARIVRMVKAKDSSWNVSQEDGNVIVSRGGKTISSDVKKYTSIVDKYAKQYDMEEYKPLIYAVIQQESDGSLTDIMQSSECPFNEDYPNVVGGITDPDYSVKAGVQYLRYCIKQADVEDPYDIKHLKLALQGYNYGHNYIEWAMKRDGGYTRENGAAFAKLMAKTLGWSSYGDSEYPDHVLRYYPEEYRKQS